MYDYDVFISYAHRDNKESSDREGWVTKFHLDLQDRLGVVLGRDPTRWRDAKLEGTDDFGDEIEERLEKVMANGEWSFSLTIRY